MNNEIVSTGEATQNSKGFNTNTLKYIAIIAMVIDHLAVSFVSDETALSIVMHFIGKITGPIMFYFVVEGYHHTKNIKKYITRLAIFAFISYFPFIYFRYGGVWADMVFLRFNVICTILLGVLAIRVRRELKNPITKLLLIISLIILCIPADWGTLGIIIIIVFDYFYGNFKNQAFGYCMVVLFDVGIFNVLMRPFYSLIYNFDFNISDYIYMIENFGMFIPIILLYFYNGQKGSNNKFSKWFFYIFYPLHLLILGFIQFLFH